MQYQWYKRKRDKHMNKHKFQTKTQSDPKDLVFPVPVRLYTIIL